MGRTFNLDTLGGDSPSSCLLDILLAGGERIAEERYPISRARHTSQDGEIGEPFMCNRVDDSGHDNDHGGDNDPMDQSVQQGHVVQ